MHLRLIIVAAVLLCFTATADTIRGTPIRPASIYLSPDASSNKLADIERGREVIVLETSGDWLHVEAVLTEEKVITGWMMNKGIVQASTPEGDKIIFGEAVDSEDQASQRHGRGRCCAGCDASLLPNRGILSPFAARGRRLCTVPLIFAGRSTRRM